MRKKQEQVQQQQIYVPAIIDSFTEATRRFPIVAQDEPDQVCGVAYRVGWIGEGTEMRALYRLRLSMRLAGYGNTTLPGFYELEDGVFVEYVQPGGPV